MGNRLLCPSCESFPKKKLKPAQKKKKKETTDFFFLLLRFISFSIILNMSVILNMSLAVYCSDIYIYISCSCIVRFSVRTRELMFWRRNGFGQGTAPATVRMRNRVGYSIVHQGSTKQRQNGPTLGAMSAQKTEVKSQKQVYSKMK